MRVNHWSLATRYLHLGMVLTISTQLLISLIMVAPDHTGGTIGKLAFDLHEVVGLTALGIILSHWAWSIYRQSDGGLKHLFPWFGEARLDVINDTKALLKGTLPQGGNRGGLPGLIHGFGLLAVSAIAITGGVLFIIFPESGKPGNIAEFFADTHSTIAALVWTYWIGHSGLAILHHLQGNDLLKKMFRFSNTIEATTATNENVQRSQTN